MAAALECWSGRPSADDDLTEQVLISNLPSSLPFTTTAAKKWRRLLQSLSSLKSSNSTTTPTPSTTGNSTNTCTTQWGTLIRNLTLLYPGSQLPEKLLSDLRLHFASLPPSYSLASFPIPDVLLHLRLLHLAPLHPHRFALHLQNQDPQPNIFKITFACTFAAALPNFPIPSCKNLQLFQQQSGATLGVAAVEGTDKEVVRERVETALRCAAIRRQQVIVVDEFQAVRAVSEGIGRWVIDSREIEFGERMGPSSFKGVCRGRGVWINRVKGLEGGVACEVEIRRDLAGVMSCGQRNVLEFVGVCVDGVHGVCTVMRMAEGGSVRELIGRRRRRVEGREVVRIAGDVAEGLMFMNGRGVAYRDLNVGRILLDKGGNALLGDMGVVAASCSDGGEVMEYETGGYRWLAPEVSEIDN